MKKVFTLFAILVIATASLYSQSVHVGLSGGYCLPLATDLQTLNAVQYQNSGYPPFYTSYRQVSPKSSGQGGNIALNVDWFSKHNIGFGLKVNALFSSPISYSYLVNYQGGLVVKYDYKDKPFSFQFMPHASFKHDFKVVSPVLEMGMLIGVTQVVEEYNALSNYSDRETSAMKFHGNVLLGFYSSLGVAFKVSPAVRITLAVNCSAGSYSPSKWNRTAYTFNGVDHLNGLSTSDKEGVFVKELDVTVSQPSNQAHHDLKYSIPFSNIGINAGITFVLSKKKITSKEKIEKSKAVENNVHPF